MKSLIQAALLSALMLATHAAAAAAPAADDAVFLEGTRYSAVLSRSQGAWRLLPAGGGDIHLRVSPDCGAGAELPRGLWLMTRDADGRPELVAPSATPLPAGHPGHVRLVDCDRPIADGEAAMALPPGLVQWLEHRSGAIYVVR
jgi:hypothetical protein